MAPAAANSHKAQPYSESLGVWQDRGRKSGYIAGNAKANPLPLLVDASQIDLTFEERWFLDFFRRTTAVTNADYFHKPFWGMLVHQSSEVQPAVRHAVIGIGSLHWSGVVAPESVPSGRMTAFSLSQCHKALGYLQQNLVADIPRRERMETVLISCGILLAFAFSQGDAWAGGCHLRAGYEVLHDWQKERMDESPIGEVVLGSFYQIFLDWPPFDPDADSKHYSYPHQLSNDYSMGVLIETPEEACGILLILGWLVLQIKPLSSTDSSTTSAPFAMLKRLHHWKDSILREASSLSRPREDTIAILGLWSEAFLIKAVSDKHLDEGEMRYDHLSSNFQRAACQGREILARDSLKSSWAKSAIVTPLFFLRTEMP